MKKSFVEASGELGVVPLQVLVELAAMSQPWDECWPEVDEGFINTLKERRRFRMGFSVTQVRSSLRQQEEIIERLPVSEFAAAILDKLHRKAYGLKPIKIFTLIHKWVHGASEDHVHELIKRGNLAWVENGRTTVILVADRLQDTENIAKLFQRSKGKEQ